MAARDWKSLRLLHGDRRRRSDRFWRRICQEKPSRPENERWHTVTNALSDMARVRRNGLPDAQPSGRPWLSPVRRWLKHEVARATADDWNAARQKAVLAH